MQGRIQWERNANLPRFLVVLILCGALTQPTLPDSPSFSYLRQAHCSLYLGSFILRPQEAVLCFLGEQTPLFLGISLLHINWGSVIVNRGPNSEVR